MGQQILRPLTHSSYQFNSTQSNNQKKANEIQSIRCCFAIRNMVSSSGQLGRWQEVAISYCEQYADVFYWKSGIISVLQNSMKDSAKSALGKKFVTEFYQIITAQISLIKQEQQRPLSPNEIKDFKQNLKNSIILNEIQLNIQKQVKNQRLRIKTQIDPNFAFGSRNTKLQLQKFKSQLRKITNNKIQLNQEMKNSRLSRNTMNSYRKTVMNLADETMTNMFRDQNKQITNYNRIYLQNFIKFTIMLESHIKNPQHQIYLLIEKFIKSLQKQISKNKQLQENQIKISKQEMERFVESIKIFIGLLVEIIYNYYFIQLLEKRQKEKCNYIITNIQNLFNIVNTIIFKNEKFYNLIFKVIKKYNKPHEDDYEQAFLTLNGKSPLYFSVPEEYCLQNQVIFSNQGEIQQTKIKLQPYEKCAQTLGNISRSKTPVGKMKAILQCANKITQTISQNYKQGGKNPKDNVLNADQILSVFCYVLSIRKIDNLSSHMFLIEHFASENQKVSITGYYFSVLCCAVQHFISEKQIVMQVQEVSGSEIDLFIFNTEKGSNTVEGKHQDGKLQVQLSKKETINSRPMSITNSIL